MTSSHHGHPRRPFPWHVAAGLLAAYLAGFAAFFAAAGPLAVALAIVPAVAVAWWAGTAAGFAAAVVAAVVVQPLLEIVLAPGTAPVALAAHALLAALGGAGAALLAGRIRHLDAQLAAELDERRRAEVLQAGQTYLLELIAAGKPLTDTLETLVHFIEAHAPEVRCLIELIDPETERPAGIVAPSLPTLPPPPAEAPASALVPALTSLHPEERVLTTDVGHDARWTGRREVLLGAGFRQAWTTPILSRDKRILGALSVLHGAPRTPRPVDYRLLDVAARLAGIATERTRAEASLRASEEKYRSVVEHVRDVVFQMDAEGRWTYLNAAWSDLTGHGVDESLGRPLFDFVHPDDRAAVRERLLEGARGDHERAVEDRLELRVVTHEEELRWMELQVRHLREGNGGAAASGTLHDVTERRQALTTLQAALDRERELSELKSRFVSMASHELRTPLATIQSSAELIDRFRHRWDETKVNGHLERIQRNVRNMTGLLEDVLLIGRADAGRLPFQPEAMDLTRFLADLAEEVGLGIGARHQLRPELPEEPVHVAADPKLLRTICHNLLANAVNYSAEGSTVHLGLERDGARVCLVVADEGIGIPASDLPRLFEPFHRGVNVGTRRGTGLGLAIVRRAVDLHRGDVRVESEEGAGTTCRVWLPVGQAEAAAAA